MVMRRKTGQLRLGSVAVGSEAAVTVQSMTTTSPIEVARSLAQIKELAVAGCEIIRIAVPTLEAGSKLKEIIDGINIPLVADIQFDYRIALLALEQGVQGLRINPGNIGAQERIKQVVALAVEREVPIRIGVNSGSLDRELLDEFGGPTPQALAESAHRNAAFFEELGFQNYKVSIKSSSVVDTIEANRLFAENSLAPLHLGVTESGTLLNGAIRSALGLGALLAQGIGDTIRVSLAAEPVEEVRVGIHILRSLGLRRPGPVVIACPTCGRCNIDVFGMAERIESYIAGTDVDIRIAVMGCAVNGPGEAREADLGIAGGKSGGVLFLKGEVVRKVAQSELEAALMDEMAHWLKNNQKSRMQ